MDATVSAVTQAAVADLQADALSSLGTLIPVAAVLLISVAIVYFVIKHFRSISHT